MNSLSAKQFCQRHLGLLLIALIALVYSLRVITTLQDFHEFYLAGQRFSVLGPLYIVPERAVDWYMGFKYPPFFAMLMVPIGFLSFGAAKTVWVCLNAISLGIVFWLLKQFTLKTFPQLKFRKTAFLAFLASYIYFDGLFVYGQVNLMLVVLQLGGIYLILRGRPLTGGFAIGMAVMMKLTPLIFIPYLLVRRAWKALFAAVSGIAICALLPGLFYGFQENLNLFVAYRAYMAERHSLTDMTNWRINDNIQNLVYSLFGPIRIEYSGYSKSVFFFSTQTATAIFLGALALVGLLYLRLLIKSTPRLSNPIVLLYEVAMLLAIQIVVSPLAAKYTFVQLLPLIFLLFVLYDKKFKWAYWALVPFGVLITIPGSFTPHKGPLLEFYWVHFWYWCYIVGLSTFVFRNYVRSLPPVAADAKPVRGLESGML